MIIIIHTGSHFTILPCWSTVPLSNSHFTHTLSTDVHEGHRERLREREPGRKGDFFWSINLSAEPLVASLPSRNSESLGSVVDFRWHQPTLWWRRVVGSWLLTPICPFVQQEARKRFPNIRGFSSEQKKFQDWVESLLTREAHFFFVVDFSFCVFAYFLEIEDVGMMRPSSADFVHYAGWCWIWCRYLYQLVNEILISEIFSGSIKPFKLWQAREYRMINIHASQRMITFTFFGWGPLMLSRVFILILYWIFLFYFLSMWDSVQAVLH